MVHKIERNFSETVNREDALRAYTNSNAHLPFKENQLGSLEKGKRADFIVLNKDYMTVSEEEINDLCSIKTVIDGKIRYER